jgi:hypothetical protein
VTARAVDAKPAEEMARQRQLMRTRAMMTTRRGDDDDNDDDDSFD